MATFQRMIEEAESRGLKEGEYSIDLIIRVKSFGKERHAWLNALAIARKLRVVVGDRVSFHLLNGESLTDGLRTGISPNVPANGQVNHVRE